MDLNDFCASSGTIVIDFEPDEVDSTKSSEELLTKKENINWEDDLGEDEGKPKLCKYCWAIMSGYKNYCSNLCYNLGKKIEEQNQEKRKKRKKTKFSTSSSSPSPSKPSPSLSKPSPSLTKRTKKRKKTEKSTNSSSSPSPTTPSLPKKRTLQKKGSNNSTTTTTQFQPNMVPKDPPKYTLVSEKVQKEAIKRKIVPNRHNEFRLNFTYNDLYGVETILGEWQQTVIVVFSIQRKYQQQYEKEIYYLSQLHHPNIVQFLGGAVEERQCFFLTELMETDLDTMLRDKNPMLNWDKNGSQYTYHIALAVKFIHSCGQVHKNINARNIFISGRRAKLSLFGIAANKEDLTMTNIDTDYRAPEWPGTLEEDDQLTQKLDIYSFGMILQKLCMDAPSVQLKALIKQCVLPDPKARPSIVEFLQIL